MAMFETDLGWRNTNQQLLFFCNEKTIQAIVQTVLDLWLTHIAMNMLISHFVGFRDVIFIKG